MHTCVYAEPLDGEEHPMKQTPEQIKADLISGKVKTGVDALK